MDAGLLVYAGATSVLDGNYYPSRQRPPMYPYFVAGLGKAAGIDTQQTAKLGKDFGSLEPFDTATDFTTRQFGHLMLRANLILWLITILFLCLTLRLFGASYVLAVVLSILPSAWAMTLTVHEAVLSQCILSIAFYFLALGLKNQRVIYFISAGLLFALAALTAALLQMLIVAVAIPLFFSSWRKSGIHNAFTSSVCIMLGLAVVGTWAYRNQQLHGFFGMSGVLGSGMGSKTALFLERGKDKYPVETPIFAEMRNNAMIYGESHTGMMWGKEANEWLMQEKGMSYAEANKFMLRFNLSAIKAAPLNYAEEVSASLARYLFPATPAMSNSLRIPLIGLEFLTIFVFLSLLLLWIAHFVLSYLTGDQQMFWNTTDTLILCGSCAFFYCALLTSLVDVGRPAQRGHIQF